MIEIKNIYIEKDSELKELIKKELLTLKEEHLNNLKQLDADLNKNLEEASNKFEGKTDTKEFKNVKFGLEIACKRAKIKERNRYNEVTTQTLLYLDHINDGNIDIYRELLRGNYEIFKDDRAAEMHYELQKNKNFRAI